MKTYSIGIIALIMLAAGGSAQASIYKNFGKWSVLCSGNLNCKIRATIGSKSAQITTLTFDRDAGPATPLTLILGTPRQTLPDAARKPTIAFSIDGAGPARMSQDALSFDRATNSWKLKDNLLSSDLINRLKGGKTLHIDFQADGALSSVDLPLTGLAASFLYADDQQDRVGHIDALTAKGDKPAAQAPPLRQFNAVAELPEQLQAVYGKGGLCYLPDETDFVELGAFVHQLTPNKAIYALPCETGYNASFLIYSRVDEKFQQMQFGSVGEESYAANLRYDWRKKTFTTHFKVSGSGNCAYDSALMLEDKPHVLSLKWIKRTETEGCAGN